MERYKLIEGLTDNDFRKEFTDIESKKIERYLARYFRTFPETFKQFTAGRFSKNEPIEDILGLPYTSSSDVAELGITNVEWKIEGNIYMHGFLLTHDNRLIGWAIKNTDNADMPEIEVHYYFTKI